MTPIRPRTIDFDTETGSLYTDGKFLACPAATNFLLLLVLRELQSDKELPEQVNIIIS